ncbi:MAG TPA: GAF domain-containing protein [Gemmatimonadaceae bacterium]|nr:GAF domain-containing protein [Gemmatimonadaceae bacterium]
MPPHTLASLAHALSAANDLDTAFVALAEGLAETDRDALVALLRVDAKSALLRERLLATEEKIDRLPLETSLAQFPQTFQQKIAAGGTFVDFGDESPEFGRMLGIPNSAEGGLLAIRGVTVDGQLSALVALVEPKRVFGTRVSERFAPMVALFELAYLRFTEREAREEAVQTLEDVTQRVHGEYVARLADFEEQLLQARNNARDGGSFDAAGTVAREREEARVAEESRRSARRLAALEQQLTAAVGQLEHAHIELHRRSEALRQRTRTLYLIERVLTLAAAREAPSLLAEGLLALVGDDMQAQRCSLFLRVPDDPQTLYLAARRGLAPHITEGSRIKVGHGVAGLVAQTREPMLVVDSSDTAEHALLGDEYLTTGSFISFPLVLHDELVGVVNLTNRAQRGLFVEEDVERVRLLGLVISLVAREAELPERLLGTIGER